MAVNREVLAQAEMPTRAARIVLDMDSSESPVHGAQEGSAYNGHFESEQNFGGSAALGCIKVPSGAGKTEIPDIRVLIRRAKWKSRLDASLA